MWITQKNVDNYVDNFRAVVIRASLVCNPIILTLHYLYYIYTYLLLLLSINILIL